MCKHCWDFGGPHHKDFIQGAVDPDDGWVETPHKKVSQIKAKPSKKPGCPGNDGKAHIYVFTTEYNLEDLFYRYFGFHKYEKRYCAGCGGPGRKVRKTERYIKKFKDSSRWGSPEYRHEGFAAFRKRWLTQRGWTPEVYGNGW